jgi:zinc protease
MLLACTGAPALASAQLDEHVDIPFTKLVLANGLTLIVHEDHKTPIVAVNVWYHVGAKDEPRGRTGFAHLFEHLMFNGTEHLDEDFFVAMERVGATELNGTTSEDRTNYFANAPKDALDFLLWMESERMGYLLGAVDQAKLEEQRAVVRNEKRQRENQPYGRVDELIAKATYPEAHPYSRTVIGSIEDLDAATLDDVREWFRAYYGAANATIVVAGDVDTETVREKVERAFGAIAPGAPRSHEQSWIADRDEPHRQLMEDRVAQARLYLVWNIPEFGDPRADLLNLVSDVLALGKTSRLDRRLVLEDRIATDVSAFVDLREIGGQFYVVATAQPGQPLAPLEKAIREELSRFLDEGPTAEELRRVKTQHLASFVRGVERIGGFGGKSDVLATYEVFTGDPGNYRRTLRNVADATAHGLRDVAREWLDDGVFVLEVVPYPEYETRADDVDRSKVPLPAIDPEVELPALRRSALPNGLQLVVAERRGNPQVDVTLQVDAGYAADRFASPGTAKLAMDVLDEGTRSRTTLEIAEALAQIGAVLETSSDLDTSSVFLSALTPHLDASLEIFADVALHPAFREADFRRVQAQQLAAIEREKSDPSAMALRVVPSVLYAAEHPYSAPLTGSGTAESVTALTPADAEKFHATWFRPNAATVIVAGDTTLEEIEPKLAALLGQWERGDVPDKDVSEVDRTASGGVYLLDRPGALQSVIFAGELAPPKANPHEVAIETMNTILGGTFTSRLNLNLREEKGWSYGTRSTIVPARGPRPFLVVAPVQTDKTREAMSAVAEELRGILGPEPIAPEELAKAKATQTLSMPGELETIAAVSAAIEQLVRFRLPDDWLETYPDRVLALETADVARAAEIVLQPDDFVWVVVGDRAVIEPELRKLDFGPIRSIDADGAAVK